MIHTTPLPGKSLTPYIHRHEDTQTWYLSSSIHRLQSSPNSRPVRKGDRQETKPEPLQSNPLPSSEPEFSSPASSLSVYKLNCGPHLAWSQGLGSCWSRLSRPKQVGSRLQSQEALPTLTTPGEGGSRRVGTLTKVRSDHSHALCPQKGRLYQLAALLPRATVRREHLGTRRPTRISHPSQTSPGAAPPRPSCSCTALEPSDWLSLGPSHIRFRVRGAWSPQQLSRTLR